jgi:hypothetical protein
MTLQLLHSDFPYIWGKFSFLFYQCTLFVNAWLSGIRSVWYLNEKRMMMPEPVRYLNEATQSGTGMLRYQTDMLYVGMPMPGASALMAMPSYVYNRHYRRAAKGWRAGPDSNLLRLSWMRGVGKLEGMMQLWWMIKEGRGCSATIYCQLQLLGNVCCTQPYGITQIISWAFRPILYCQPFSLWIQLYQVDYCSLLRHSACE